MRIQASLILMLSCTATVGAQSRGNAFADFTVGANLSIGTLPVDRKSYGGGPTYVYAAVGNQPDANRPLIAALHLGINFVMGSHAGCDLGPLGGCLQEFPFGPLIAITVGARPARSLVELTAGPALIGLHASGMAFGAMAVGRIGLPPGQFLSPGVAIHVLAAPTDGAMVIATGIGFSLRTW